MVKPKRVLLLAAAGLAALALAYMLAGGGTPAPVAVVERSERAPSRTAPEPELPRVGLDRVQQATARPPVGRRDIFDFGPEPRQQQPVVAATLGPAPEPTPTPVPTPTPLPALNVKYIGSLETKRGLKVAFFMTEKKEVLSGQSGETVMNRFRVVRIGFESVDVQQVGADQVQRLPLKAN